MDDVITNPGTVEVSPWYELEPLQFRCQNANFLGGKQGRIQDLK